jgi:hypothetical protein
LFFSYESRPEIAVPTHAISAVEWLFLNTFCMHLINIPTYHITQTHTIPIQHFGAATTWDAPTRLEFGMIIAMTMVSSSNIEYINSRSGLIDDLMLCHSELPIKPTISPITSMAHATGPPVLNVTV